MVGKRSHAASIAHGKQKKPVGALISERFPKVSDIVMHMTYYHQGVNPVLMVRTLNIFPKDPADFKMVCMIKGCLNGGFDLTPALTNLIKKRKTSGKGSLSCKGKNENRVSCSASITYEVNIKYKR